MLRNELPGDVLIELRTSRGYMSARAWAEGIHDEAKLGGPSLVTAFAELTGWGYDKLNNIEGIRWGSDREKWRTRFTRRDLNDLVKADWVKPGDEMFSRFEKSMVWQAKVLLYGTVVYQEVELDASPYSPISVEHLSILVRAVLAQAGPGVIPPMLITEEMRVALEQWLLDDTLFVLMVLQLGRRGGEGEEDAAEVTRGLQQIKVQGSDTPETPYLRTLRFAYRCVTSLLYSEVENLIELQRKSPAEIQ
jgi:hypothetical protein